VQDLIENKHLAQGLQEAFFAVRGQGASRAQLYLAHHMDTPMLNHVIQRLLIGHNFSCVRALADYSHERIDFDKLLYLLMSANAPANFLEHWCDRGYIQVEQLLSLLPVLIQAEHVELCHVCLEKIPHERIDFPALLRMGVDTGGQPLVAEIINAAEHADVHVNINELVAHAARRAHLPMLRYLIEEQHADGNFDQALQWAIRVQSQEMVQYLLANHAARLSLSVNAHWAQVGGYPEFAHQVLVAQARAERPVQSEL